jgi:hypothetical protein
MQVQSYYSLGDVQMGQFLPLLQVSGVTLAGTATFTTLPTGIEFSGGGGSGASGTLVFSGNTITGVTMTNGGQGYTSVPTVNLVGGTGMTGSITLTATVVPFSIYDTGPNANQGANLSPLSGGGYGFGTTGTCAQISSIVAGNVGSVAKVFISSSGGYTSPPNVSFGGSGPGSGARARAVVDDSGQLSVFVINGGSGYSAANPPTVTFTGGGGTASGHVDLFSADKNIKWTPQSGSMNGYVTLPVPFNCADAFLEKICPGQSQAQTYSFTVGVDCLS